MHGGDMIARVLQAHRVRHLFTLCGGHISPILVACKHLGIQVIDVRHEATAVFAADAVARLTGIPGVAAVTAGPGATNTITAVKNAQLAQSPLILLGGATATALKGRGALQDINQMALFKPHVKWAKTAKRVSDLIPILERGFAVARHGVPGPVFIECPVDLLYDEAVVREWYGLKSADSHALMGRLINVYLNWHVNRLFKDATGETGAPHEVSEPLPDTGKIRRVAEKLRAAKRPAMLIGSQALANPTNAGSIASAVAALGVPVYLSGMARGLLGRKHPLLLRHKRRQALKEADLLILAGVPNDFRLDYGRHIRRSTYLISVNRSRREMVMNRRPDIGVPGDPGYFLCRLAETSHQSAGWLEWLQQLRARDQQREEEIDQRSGESSQFLNPLRLCRELEAAIAPDSVIVADGGDFVATASYILSPRQPLSWLDPGVFGTLGVGAGFALGARLCRPEAEIWILYGDGSVGYSLAEFDTFVRHHIPVIAVVGNDAGWTQIAREQVEIFKDDVGTVLNHSDYHRVAEGFGAKGYLLKETPHISSMVSWARESAAQGHAVLINAYLSSTDFRKGSISM